MKAKADSATISFTAKGQIVIPPRYRRQFRVAAGTRAVVTATPEGILIKPLTSRAIARGFGLLKRNPEGKSFAARWSEHKREEKALEERKFGGSLKARGHRKQS